MGLQRIWSDDSTGVLSRRDLNQMIRVHTASNVATVIDLHALDEWTNPLLIAESMSKGSLLALLEAGVASTAWSILLGERALPEPTAILVDLQLRHKAFDVRHSGHAADSNPRVGRRQAHRPAMERRSLPDGLRAVLRAS